MVFKMIISGLLGAGLLAASAPVHADPCAKKKDPAERIICQMAAAKTPAEADALTPSLGKLKSAATKQIKKVLGESKNGQLRAAVACAMPMLGADATSLIPDVLRLLNDQYPPVRRCALRTVGAISPAAMPALPLVLDSLDHKDIKVQIQAMEALGAIWPVAPVAISDMVRVLEGKRDKRIKYGAVEFLAHFGALASMAVPSLRKAMFAPDPKLQAGAVAVVAAMAPASWTELPSLIKLAGDKKYDPEVRKAAAAAMAKMGRYGKKYEPGVKDALKSEGAPTAELKAAMEAFNAK